MSGEGARRNRRTALVLAGVASGMLGMAYAAVPLYEIYCRVTGFGGTTQVADKAPAAPASERVVTVRFDANVAHGMGWQFAPAQTEVRVKVGETALAFYRASNPTDRRIVGTATFNVTPLKVGIYFDKVECFCFTEQVLDPGQTVDMPVSFYVDPEILKDPRMNDVKTIILSYTFFKAREESPAPAGQVSRNSTGVAAGRGAAVN